MYNLEQSCRIQLDALAAVGRDGVTLISDAVVGAHAPAGRAARPAVAAEYRDWPALLRMLDRKGINYHE